MNNGRIYTHYLGDNIAMISVLLGLIIRDSITSQGSWCRSDFFPDSGVEAELGRERQDVEEEVQP